MWTDEQLRAIEESGHNILVSAGAGSGKTAVLTERVIRRLKKGVNIDEFLILTFTKAAAKEMKERIEEGIKESQLNDQLSKLDLSYITTFDSFALSILKKYHYKLGVSKNIEIEQGGLIEIEKRKILDKIFEEYYDEDDANFNNFITSFCIKDDTELKKMILQANDKLDLKYDKILYLENYLSEEYQESIINQKIDDYEKMIIEKINQIKDYLQDFHSFVDEEYYNNFKNSISFLEKKSYEEIVKSLNIKLPNLPKGSIDSAKEIKEEISKLYKEIISLCNYQTKNEMKEYILRTKDTIDVIIKIIIELEKRLEKYKKENNLYTFSDVAKKVIFLLKTDEHIRLELQQQFYEIMIDEYQDTSDIQEEFISLIQNNNVYMVGDIKQSIYRFRNANPYIFKRKYEEYKQHKDGEKIDLTKNFRSRDEVIFNINEIFNELMDNNFGGAEYRKEHQMIFGNQDYKKTGENNQNNFLEIIKYPDIKEYNKEEIEAFVIARDIKKRIENQDKIMDKKSKKLKTCNYHDFVILVDKSKNFSIYKKIFEYLNIPLTICRDDNVMDNINIPIIKNIIELAILEKENNYNKDYIFYFMSIARSYLFEYSDDFIFNCIKENKYESSLLDKIHNIIPYFGSNISIIIDKIIEEFEMLSNIIKIGNIEENIAVLDYLKEVSQTLELMGYDIIKWKEYLNDLMDNKISLSYSFQKENTNSVKIMTIHGSKGLEFPICYYSGLYSKFNIRECSEKILFDNGFVVPVIEDSVRYTIEKELLKKRYYREEISERIRLFYVALTRAREKMIVLADSKDLKQKAKNDYRSFKDMLGSIDLEKYVVSLSLDQINPTKEYNYIIKNEVKKDFDNNIVVDEINIPNEYIEQKSFSKNSCHTKDDIDKMKLGTKIHSILEVIDFDNPSFEGLDIEYIYQEKIKRFLNNELLNGNKYYREYEFEYEDDNIIYHGIIDLMIEDNDTIRIIDYKLKNINDESYFNQLKGYQKYISSITDKKVEIYLYSILDEQIKKIF